MDKSMLQANIQLTHELDKAFGLPPKITMSQVHSYMPLIPLYVLCHLHYDDLMMPAMFKLCTCCHLK